MTITGDSPNAGAYLLFDEKDAPIVRVLQFDTETLEYEQLTGLREDGTLDPAAVKKGVATRLEFRG